MPRPREPFADALRTAREIVDAEVDALARAAAGGDSAAYEAARHALVIRIAQAVTDASEAGGQDEAA